MPVYHRGVTLKSAFAAVALTIAFGATAAFAQTVSVSVTFLNGRVTVTAANASATDILAEWSRVGRTAISGETRLSPQPLTFQLSDVDEEQALARIIGSDYGFGGVVKPSVVPGTSQFARLTFAPAPHAGSSNPPPPEPESIFDYTRPRNSGADPLVGIDLTKQSAREPSAEPEKSFEYSVPARVREAMERRPDDAPSASPAPPPAPDTPFVDPELRFEYYRPLKSIPKKDEKTTDPTVKKPQPPKR
jgi:hypothetical protein